MEEWRDIEGYEGLYQVSEDGRVRSLDRQVTGRNCMRTLESREMRQMKNHDGYHRLSLCKNGTVANYSVHRLVAIAWIPNPDNLPCVLHKNDIPESREAKNLYWGTLAENMQDKFKRGRANHPVGEKAGASKLKEKEVHEIKKLLKEPPNNRLSILKIAKLYSVTTSTIYDIRYGNTWKHIKLKE